MTKWSMIGGVLSGDLTGAGAVFSARGAWIDETVIIDHLAR
jgi:hypothetical protein